jgi:Zn-dependent protease
MQEVNILALIIILLVSVILHEVAHGYAALFYGDKTAYYAGRLTLNPIKHLDWFSSVLLPALLILFQFPFPFAAAKPVPVNLRNVKSGKHPRIVIALAGIATNFFLAVIFAILIRLSTLLGLSSVVVSFFALIVLINISLTLFNLLPIPPLDGSRVVVALLPARFQQVEHFLDTYGFVILIGVMPILNIFGIDILSIPVRVLFRLLTGTMI